MPLGTQALKPSCVKPAVQVDHLKSILAIVDALPTQSPTQLGLFYKMGIILPLPLLLSSVNTYRTVESEPYLHHAYATPTLPLRQHCQRENGITLPHLEDSR